MGRAFPQSPLILRESLFTLLLSPLINKIAVFGPLTVFENLIEQFIAFFISSFPDQVEELPLTCDIPESMCCPICREDMKNPVVLLGTLFCGQCLSTWLKRHNVHPVTGQQVSADTMKHSFVMEITMHKWRKLVLADHTGG